MNKSTLVRSFWMAVTCCFFSFIGFGQLTENKETGNHVKLIFKNNVSGQPLVIGNSYTNSFGEKYTVLKFRYYITQILLVDSSDMRVQFFPNDYFLLDAEDSSTRTISIPLSLKHISYISFLVGVDSESNVSGTQQGALDPANGMFWTWNTGYIMAKLQGTSPEAKSAANAFSFDAGGYKTGENAARKVEFTINTLKGKNKTVHTVVIETDVNKWFNGVHPIKIAEHAGCHEPGALAMQIADNYATMFSLESVTR